MGEVACGRFVADEGAGDVGMIGVVMLCCGEGRKWSADSRRDGGVMESTFKHDGNEH